MVSGVKRWGNGFRDIDAPLQTVLAGGNGAALVDATFHTIAAPHITKFNTGSIGHNMEEPLATITSGGASERPAGAPHGLGVVCAYLAKHFQGAVGASIDAPMPTVTTVDHNSLVVANLVGIDNQSSGDSAVWDAKSPLNTITTENRHAVVTSNLVKLRGTSNAVATNEPLATISAGGQHHAEVRTTLQASSTDNLKRQKIREFLWEFCPGMKGNPQPELVTVYGQLMEVVDIGLRMLTPRELATAQGFRKSYILDPEYTTTNKRGKTVTKRLSQSAQIRMIGNSVSPKPAEILIRANSGYELELAKVA